MRSSTTGAPSVAARTLAATLFFAIALGQLVASTPVRADAASDCTQDQDLPARIRGCTEFIASSHGDAAAFYFRANAYVRIGNFDRGIADYTTAIHLKPDFIEALADRAGAHLLKSETNLAIVDYTEILRFNPGLPRVYVIRGTLYAATGKMAPAIADATSAIRLKADYPEAFRLRGNAFAEDGRQDLAIADFTEAIRLQPDFAAALIDRGLSYRDKGEMDLAIADFKKGLELPASDNHTLGLQQIARRNLETYGRSTEAAVSNLTPQE